MKLFKIYQDINIDDIGYDSYDSAIVAATDEETARKIHPSGENETWISEKDMKYGKCWCKPEDVKVKYIGEAAEDIKQGVICASLQ